MNKKNTVDDMQNIPRPKLERHTVDDMQNIPRPKLERHTHKRYKYLENDNLQYVSEKMNNKKNEKNYSHSTHCHLPIMDYETYETKFMISKTYNN